MPSPVSIALRLRAFLLLGLLLRLAVSSAWAAAPRAAVVRPARAATTQQARLTRPKALHQEANTPSYLGLFRPDVAAAALLPTPAFYSPNRIYPAALYQATPPLTRPVWPLLRLRLRASLSPNAP